LSLGTLRSRNNVTEGPIIALFIVTTRQRNTAHHAWPDCHLRRPIFPTGPTGHSRALSSQNAGTPSAEPERKQPSEDSRTGHRPPQRQLLLAFGSDGGGGESAKSSQGLSPRMTRKPNTQNRAPLMCLSGQPALKVRLAASSKRDGNEWAWVVNVNPAAATVWTERTCCVAVNAAKNARAVL